MEPHSCAAVLKRSLGPSVQTWEKERTWVLGFKFLCVFSFAIVGYTDVKLVLKPGIRTCVQDYSPGLQLFSCKIFHFDLVHPCFVFFTVLFLVVESYLEE